MDLDSISSRKQNNPRSPINSSHRSFENDHSGGLALTLNSLTPSKDQNNQVTSKLSNSSRKIEVLRSLANNPYFDNDEKTRGLKDALDTSMTRIEDKLVFDIKSGNHNIRIKDYASHKIDEKVYQMNIKSKRNSAINRDIFNLTHNDQIEPIYHSNMKIAVTPEMTKHSKLYLHHMPIEIKKIHNQQKNKEKLSERELREKDKSNLKLLKRIKKDKEQRAQKILEYQQKQEQLQMIQNKKEAQSRRETDMINLKQREERKKLIDDKIASRNQDLKSKSNDAKQRTKEMLASTPLYKRWEEKSQLPMIPFNSDSHRNTYFSPDHEKEKEVLDKIKQEHQPIRLKEIKKFARKMQRIKEKKLHEKRKQFQKRLSEQRESFDPLKYLTKFQKSYIENQKLQKLEQEIKEREKLDLVKKKKKFSQIVSMTHKPAISEKKKKEIELRQMLERNPGRMRARINKQFTTGDTFSTYEHAQKSENTSCIKLPQKSTEVIPEIIPKKHKKAKRKQKILDWQQFTEKPVPKKSDYLKDKRIIRELKESYSRSRAPHFDILKNQIDNKEERIKYMEEETKRQEQRSRFCEDGATSSEINDMWIQNIKAKIEYVDHCLTE